MVRKGKGGKREKERMELEEREREASKGKGKGAASSSKAASGGKGKPEGGFEFEYDASGTSRDVFKSLCPPSLDLDTIDIVSSYSDDLWLISLDTLLTCDRVLFFIVCAAEEHQGWLVGRIQIQTSEIEDGSRPDPCVQASGALEGNRP